MLYTVIVCVCFFFNDNLSSLSLPSSTCFILAFIFHFEIYFGLYVNAEEVGVIIYCYKELLFEDLKMCYSKLVG